MADWDVISEERVATPPAPRPQRNQAAADPWAVVDEFDPNEGVGAEAQGVARPSSLGDTIFNALTRGWERAKSGFQSFDDALQLRGEAVSRKSLGEILTQRAPRPDPGSAMLSGLGMILDLAQKGGRAVTSMVEGEDAVAAKDQAARAEIARLGVRQALAADANPSSALADQIGRLNTGSFLGDMGEAGQLIFGDGVLEGLQRLGALALEYGAETLPGSLPGMAGAIGGGLVGGLPGAVGGGAAGFGSSSAAQQYGLTVLEFLDGRGVNVRDAAAVEEALADPQILQQALDYAGTKTGISASAEAFAGALGPGMLIPRRLMGSALGRELTNALVAQPVAQGVIGTAGDVGADMAVGEDPRIAASLIQNVLGEAALSPMETIGARGAARARERAESKADAARASKDAGFTPVDEAPDLGRPAPADPAPPPGGPAPQAPADVMAGAAAPDLTPRQPAAATVTEGETREQLIEQWRAAATPDERAAAAARIAAYDALRRDAEDLGDAGLRGSPEEGGPASPGVRAGVQAGAADGQAGARAVPGELPPADPGAAEGQAPRMVRDAPAGLTDPYQDTDDPAIREALGSAAAGITVHRTISDIRPEDRERIGLTENDTDVEGFYDPDTGRVHIIEANLATEGVDPETGERWTMTRDQRRVWVAAHERSGHAGTRGMFAAAEGSNAAGSQALARELDRASQNEVIAAIVAAMERQRPERGRILVEEAIVEIAAAVRTGDYGHIQQRYGVEVPAAARAGLRGTIARIVEAIRRAFGRVGRGFSDADIYRLIEGAHRYAQRGEVRGTSRRAEQQRGPVAQRAYHGSPTRGIDRFSLDKIGTGEGNQSFGWGLYFTGKREVGDTYRRSLSPVGRIAGGALGDRLIQEQGSQRAALEVISRMRRAGVNSAERMLGEKRWSRGGGEPDFVRARMMEELDAAEAFIRRNAGRGQLYQVDLPEDHELLNYDAPLDKQPEKVRAAIERLLPPDAQERLILTRNPRGVDYYNAIGRHISEQKYGFPFPAGEDINMAREASLALAAEGVPGLRYLNGESRSADGGIDPGPTAYNYVIWDESRIGTPEPLIASRASRILRNLTPEEQRKVTDKVAAKIEEQLTKLPPKREMAAAAIAGQAKRGWYRQSAETISAVFGPDAPLFAGLLAATSPQISVEGNLKNALSIWRDWIAAGRPTGEDEILAVMRSALRRSFGGSLRAWEPNVVRALQGRGILSGPKVNSFMRNLLGDVEEVTNDAWMANFANVSQTIFKGAINVRETDPGKGAGYLAMNARVREVARELTRLTGETWTPAEVQETVWSWAKTITEMADSAGEIRSAEELVLDRAVTDELIASTPDFGSLFTQPEYRQILEEAGYADQLEQVSAQRDAARAAGEEPGARRQASPFAEEDQLRLERRAARRIDALRRARREAAAVEEEAAEEVPFSRGEPGRFEPLPGAPKIKGATGPDKRLVRIAERYAKENGIELRRQRAYVKADPERGARIAAAYEAMEHAPNDPRVRAAYQELIRQTVAQYRALEDAGYRFWFADPENDPYQGNPWNAMRDLRANQSMAVFPTVAGFGSGATDIDVSDNPLMADTGIRWPWGAPDGELRPVLANDLFRAVHDAFGHGLEGAGFRADGEENAWQAHVRLFTGAAVAAITTETRGQNSWLNFGPYGERNRTASVEDTIFADQKTGLLPEWTWTEGRADDEGYVASRGTRDLFPNEMASLDTLSSERRIVSSKGDSEPRGNVDSSGGMISALRQGVDNFWRWFGDSKAVDDEGRPLRMYHATGGNFDAFEIGRESANSMGIFGSFKVRRSGVFVTPSVEFAEQYLSGEDGDNVMPLYIKAEDPLDLRTGLSEEDYRRLSAVGARISYINSVSNSWELFDNEDDGSNQFVDWMRAAGYDSAILHESGPVDADVSAETWVVLDPSQVKSATGNIGTFDPADPSIIASRGFSAKKRQPDAVSVDAYHYSTQEGLKRLDPARAGSAGAGRERRRFGMGQFGQHGGTAARVNFYVREPGEDIPQPEDVVRDAGATHLYRVQLDNLYDADSDPRGIVENAINADEMEEEISDAGFDGIYYRNPAGIDQPVAVVFDIGKKKIPVEPVEDGVIASRGARNPQIDTPEFRRWFGDSKVVDENGEPLVVYHGTKDDFTKFDKRKSRTNKAFFFATDPGFASSPAYTGYIGGRAKAGGNVMPVYLSIKNPLVLDDLSYNPMVESGVIDEARNAGHDGIHVTKDGRWIAFEPKQIKSATGNSGAFDPSNPSIIASRGFSAKKRQPDAVSVDAYHYSTQEGLKRLDPARAGSAGAGRERRRFGMGQFGQHGGTAARVNFYVREPGEDIPQPEDVVRDAGATHVYRVQLDNLYDADNDPRGIVENAINADEMEEEISDAGFDGIYYRDPPGIDQPVAVVFDIGKKKIPVEPVEEGVIASRGTRNPQIDTPEFRRWFGDSKVVDEQGRPRVVYHGTGVGGFTTFRAGGWFAEDRPAAEQHGPVVYEAYLRIENPATDDDLQELFFNYKGRQFDEDEDGPSLRDLAFYDKDFYQFVKDAGHDGLIVHDDSMDIETTAYVAFEPEQIKSATDNSGAFDPADPSIIASRRTPADARRERNSLFGRLAAAGYRMGNATQPQQQTGGRFVRLQYAADNVRTALQDKMLPLLRAQERVAENGPAVTSVTLDDAMNAYRMENLMHGAVKNGLDRVHQSYIQPIQDAIRKSPFTMAMFEDYLYAKAAPERNAEIAKINPAMPDSGSGISTKLAKDILSGAQPGAISGEVLTAGARALFAQLEPLVRKMRDEVLDNMVSAGQITPALADQLRKKYPNYIPMRGKDGELDESRPARGRGISQPRSSGLRRALGRGDTNVPQNIMGELVGDLQRSIVAKEKGKVARAMLRFAMAHPQPDLYTVEPVDLEWKFSEATGEAYLGVKRRGEDVDSSMIVMHEGKPVYLRFVDPALRDAVLNMSVNDMTAMARWLGWINRWRSAVLTRYNPAFTPVNMFRDLQFGLVAVAAELGAASAARTAKLYPGAMRAAFRHASRQRGDASKPNAQKSMDDWAAEFYETGASTGLTHVDDVVNLQRRLVAASSSVMELAAGGRPIAAVAETLRRVGGPIVDAVENANEASENALRLAVYIEQRQRGISRDRAAEYAKNVTINFNRKGNATNLLNALYLFFNAAMQGTHAVIRVLRNRKVQVYLAGLAGLQGLLAAQMMGDDDDDGITDWDAIPDYVKRTSLIIPINGGEDYFALPMPYGFNVFTYLGGRGTQRMMLGDRPTDSSVLLDLLKATTEAFSPVPFQDGYRSLFGDQIGFMMGLAANTDDFGSPITQRDPFPDYPVPAALEGKVTTPRAYHVAAQMLAKLGGADLDERIPPVGYLDIAPEQLEAVTEYFGGGLANLANRGASWLEQMSAGNLEGATSVISKLPIASRMIGHVDHQRAISDRYYGERGEFKRHRDIVSQRLEGGASLEEAVADRPPEYVAGMRQARYKRSGRTATGRRYRKGQPRTDAAGLPVIEEAEGHAGLALKAAEKRVREINQAIRRIRAGDMTNEELVDLYVARSQDFQGVGLRDERYTGGHPDLGLPNDYMRDVKAPARVRNRAIAILQELREAHQQRFLKHLERDRRRGDEQ